ncbi:alpha/beta fold hydrolase [Plantactinospora sp. S1510]|uniref:Alpha/beta fold hydrolase n=1 Tax=Plantactinospora alkalitolerans TaxID=2789879 RepID=A0ABS0H5X1_9ACTN|nr:alpha/beta fold hydrolase [Plantactinospora alkalitolerans]MBF9133512.1 alpha/beta fold hydrolase [Plantactinospora alkalitolerans]
MITTQHLRRPEGRIAYDVQGSGPLVICVPGMAELRQTYRLLVPRLLDAGFRVATIDIRGHGDSDATFTAYDDVALAGDLLALVDELGGPAVVVGNSMGAAAGVIAAAEAPAKVSGLALLGPFVREPEIGAIQKLLIRALFLRPWGPAALLGYYPKWLPGAKPEGYEEHKRRVRDNLRRPGHWQAFVRTSRTSHEPARRRLADVTAPAVVVMGAADVDWADPGAEAEWIGGQLRAEVVMVPEVGHFPQVQAPAVVAAAVTRLVEQTSKT